MKGMKMNWNIIDGNLRQFKGKTDEALSKEDCIAEGNVLPRRQVLRGVLAFGCGLLLPTIFLGCDSKKSVDANSSVPESASADSAASSTSAAAPASAAKVSQASVQYQTQPKGEQKCSGCINLIAGSNACKLVDGQISPDGWCILWAKKI
jgi:hypothetical protein